MRNRLLLPLMLYSSLLLVGTLWPLDFRSDDDFIAEKITTIEWIPFSYRCPHCGFDYKDKILNLGMFLPFGFLLARYISEEETAARRLLKVGGMGFLFSLAIEVVQLFLPARTTQASDLVMNTFGSLAGAAFTVWYSKYKNHYFPKKEPEQERS